MVVIGSVATEGRPISLAEQLLDVIASYRGKSILFRSYFPYV